MIFNSRYWPGVTPAYTLLFFFMSYIFSIDLFRIPIEDAYSSLILFFGIMFILLANTTRKRYILRITSNLNGAYLYLIFLGAILSFSSLFALNPVYSLTRALYSVGMLGLTLTAFYIIQYIYIQNNRWQKFFEISSFLFLLLIIIGQLLIPEWSTGLGGIRLSGGTNPNSIAFVALFILVQMHMNALLVNRWSKLQAIVWVIALIVIIWTFSRSTYLILAFIYFIYVSYFLLNNIIMSLKGGIRIKKTLMSFLKIAVFIVASVFAFRIILDSNYYVFIADRLLNIENVVSRTSAWSILLSAFKENPLFGGLGWWESTQVLGLVNMEGVASSSHNLFIRLLSEVGIIGMFTVLLCPTYIALLLILNKSNINTYFQNPIAIFNFSVIIAIFTGQFFEDRYMIGTFSVHHNIIVWFLSISLIIHHVTRKNSHREQELL